MAQTGLIDVKTGIERFSNRNHQKMKETPGTLGLTTEGTAEHREHLRQQKARYCSYLESLARSQPRMVDC